MRRWLLFVYQLPSEPSAPRVAVWRALKRLDGDYLQDGVFVLRYSRLGYTELENLAHDVRNYGGTAVLLETSRVDGEQAFVGLTRKQLAHMPKRVPVTKKRSRPGREPAPRQP